MNSLKLWLTLRVHGRQAYEEHMDRQLQLAVGAEYRGWYRKLISEIHYHLKAVGAQHVYLTTQEQNTAVLQTWKKLGYEHAKTERIFRRIVAAA